VAVAVAVALPQWLLLPEGEPDRDPVPQLLSEAEGVAQPEPLLLPEMVPLPVAAPLPVAPAPVPLTLALADTEALPVRETAPLGLAPALRETLALLVTVPVPEGV
jgi:hypothetical protein